MINDIMAVARRPTRPIDPAELAGIAVLHLMRQGDRLRFRRDRAGRRRFCITGDRWLLRVRSAVVNDLIARGLIVLERNHYVLSDAGRARTAP